MADSARSLIIGGGPAGLSAGLHLDDPDAILADKNSRPGGLCRSVIEDGFTFDHAGHIFFTSDPYVDGLFREVLGENLHYQRRESRVYLYDTYQRYPFQTNLYGLPPDILKECLLGFIEARRPGHSPAPIDTEDGPPPLPENFLEWSRRTFGEGITRHFMRPYNLKVWGIDPALMSCDWIADRVLVPTLEEVVEGSLRRGRENRGPNATFGYPLRGGCEMFVSGLARRVQGRGLAFAQNRALIRVDPLRRRATFRVEEPGSPRVRSETISYGALFTSAPLPDLIAAIEGAPEVVRRAAAGLPTTAVICVNLGINRGELTDKHWIYYPEGQDKFIFQRIFVQSNASPFTAPPGHSALTFEISHSKYKPLPVRGKRALIDACVMGLRRTDLWRDGDEVVFEQVLGIRHAYLPFTPDRQAHLDVIHGYLHRLGIHPIGRAGEWRYLNQDGAILSALRIVRAAQSGEPARPARGDPE